MVRRARRAVVLVVALLVGAVAMPGALADVLPPLDPPDLLEWHRLDIDLPTNDVAYEPTRDAFLATVAGRERSLGNELVELDPRTGALLRHVWVGSEPWQIALSDDGSTAYVSLRGASEVAQVDLATFTLVRSFPLGGERDFLGYHYAGDMVVPPGRSDTVVLVELTPDYSPASQGVQVYRDGVRLPGSTEDWWGETTELAMTDADTVWGVETGVSSFALRQYRLDDDGIHQVGDAAWNGLESSWYTDIAAVGPLVLTSDGRLVEPTTRVGAKTFPAGGDQMALGPGPVPLTAAFLSNDTLRVYLIAGLVPLEERTFRGVGIGQEGWTTANALAAGLDVYAVSSPHGLALLGPTVHDSSAFAKPGTPPSLIDDLVPTPGPTGAVAVAYSAPRDEVVASIAHGHGDVDRNGADRLAIIDPRTGRETRSLPLPVEPGALAMSEDGTQVWVALLNHLVIRVRLSDLALTKVLDLRQVTTSTCCAQGSIGSVVVRPGHPDDVLVTLPNWWEGPGTIVSSVSGALHTYDSRYVNSMAMPDASTVVLTISLSGNNLQQVHLADDGSMTDGGHTSTIPSFPGPVQLDRSGRLYISGTSTGTTIIDPEIPSRVGSLAGSGTDFRTTRDYPYGVGTGRLDEARNRFFGLSGRDLVEWDLTTLRAVDSQTIGAYGGYDMVRTSAGFAAAVEPEYDSTATLVDPHGVLLLRPPRRPSITSVTPASGVATGGTQVTITGDELYRTRSVRFGSIEVPFTRVSNTELRAAAPPGTGTVAVSVTNSAGTSPAAPAASFTYVSEPPFRPVGPIRLLDTRPGSKVGQTYGAPRAGNVEIAVVPSNADLGLPPGTVAAVALSVTATEPKAPGFLTVWACDQPFPPSSNVNVTEPNQTVANLVLTKVSDPQRYVCIYTEQPTHVIVDLMGILPVSSGFTAVGPNRILDTRTSLTGATAVLPGSTTRVPVAGKGGVPKTRVGAVALNLTVTGSLAPGWVTAWPCDRPRPTASSLNLDRAGQTVANLVVTDLGPKGDVCVYASGGGHLIVDVTGWWVAGTTRPGGPTRLLDTRNQGPKPAAGSTVEVQVAGVAGVPAPSGVSGAVLNVTATAATGPGWVTVWPCGQPRPTTSNLNLLRAGQTVAVSVATGLGADGKVCLSTSGGTHLIADLDVWFPAAPS